MVSQVTDWTKVASLSKLQETNVLTVNANGQTVVLFNYDDSVYAVDNRCPHMGFPLNKGTVNNGILTCHWHHARFDLASGGTFDQWADDIPAFPVRVDGDDIYVDTHQRRDPREHHRQRVQDGLKHNISLVIAKSVLGLSQLQVPEVEAFTIGMTFGAKNRAGGWERGLTTLSCMINLIPYLDKADRPRALYHGLSDVAGNTSGQPPHHPVDPLPDDITDIPTLKAWFRRFIEVRDAQAAERALVSALQAGADDRQIADMLFAAATDHRYLDDGHTLDFINKALEGLDTAGWEHAHDVLPSLPRILADAMRNEESNAWRAPIDLVEILEAAFDVLPEAVAVGEAALESAPNRDELVDMLLGDDPQAIVDTLLNAVRAGVPLDALAGVVTYAAARRIAHFHTSNEFGDWDTAMHTFTFANAVHMGLRRVQSVELLRGVFDAAMSIYLDRFLNIPSTPLPTPTETTADPETLLGELASMLNKQQQVNQSAKLVMTYIASGGDVRQLMAQLGKLLLREDRNFHTIQCVEAAFRQVDLLGDDEAAHHVLIAATRYLAAHAPTMRAQGQTYEIAVRLAHGDDIFA